MKSPFVNFPETDSEAYNNAEEMYDEINFKSPFRDSTEAETREMEWEGGEEHLVDEEGSRFDVHESDEDRELENDGGIDVADEHALELYEDGTATKIEPLPVPEGKPIPFAPAPAPGSFWPIITTHKKGREVAFIGVDRKYRGNVGRRFLASRSDGGRYHVGIDLWANDKDPVVACEDGTIVNFYHFYRSTYALLVEHKNVVVNYGEVHKDSLAANNLKVGDKVKAGQVIALVGKMYSSSMLHFETYIKGTRSNKRFKVGGSAPKELLNPTNYLLFLQDHGLQGKSTSVPSALSQVSTPSKSSWSRAIELNRSYGYKLGWDQHIYAINDLLLKAAGQSDISLGEEAFAEGVAVWQSKNGFSQKDADGIIGPNTWKKMQKALGLLNESASETFQSMSQDEWDEENVSEENLAELVALEEKSDDEGMEALVNFENDNAQEVDYEMEHTDETNVDHGEWEEDSSEAARTDDEFDALDTENDIYAESETPLTWVKKALFTGWYNAASSGIIRFPDEPRHNVDQFPIPPWINAASFYRSFIQKHGGDAKTIIGDSTQKVHAKYFVLHDTAVAADFNQRQIKGKGIHLWINAQSPVLLGNDWHVKGLGVKLERKRNNTFLHVEITRDKTLYDAVQKKTNGKKVTTEEIVKEGGIRNFGTYYTDRQYELAAYAYLVASIRKGQFLTVTMHREVDRSVVVKRTNGQYGYGHDDPQFFDLDYFYDTICRLLAVPAKVTFGIQTQRALAQNQGNMAGYVNSFIPFVVGDVKAANQYGNLVRLDPKPSKYKVVKLKYGYYYDVTGLKNKFEQKEIDEEILSESPAMTTVTVPPLIAEAKSVPGYTCYVRIDLGKGNYPLIMTGIYVPAAFNPAQPVDVVLYLHGMTNTFPGPYLQIIDYWSVSNPPVYDLRIREDINASGRNVVLVAPSLGDSPNKYRNQLSSYKNGLDNYMEKVLLALNTHVVKNRFNARPLSFRHIILAAHSAGGMQMLKIATSDNPVYGPKILECWGFDSMYGPVANIWYNWATKNKNKKLIVYYQSTTEGNTKLLASKATKLPNVFTKKSPAKNHYWVVKHHLKERVMKIGQSDLTKMNFEDINDLETSNDYIPGGAVRF